MKLFKNKTALAALATSALTLFGQNATAKSAVELQDIKPVNASLSSIEFKAGLLESNPSGPAADRTRSELLQLAGRRGGNRGGGNHGSRGGNRGGNHGDRGGRNGGGRGGHERSGHTGYAC